MSTLRHDVSSRMHEMPEINDRRTCQRYRISVPLLIVSGGHEISAYSSNLSNCGVYCKLPSTESTLIEHEFELMIILPPEITHSGDCRIRCHGQLVRRDPIKDRLDETGIAARIVNCSVLSGAARTEA